MTPQKLGQTIKTASVLAICAVLLSACVVKQPRHQKARIAHPAKAKVVVIKKGHAHGKSCGHYKHNAKWYHHQGHVHGRKCGHAFVGGVWVFR